jgi:hypothetical protein
VVASNANKKTSGFNKLAWRMENVVAPSPIIVQDYSLIDLNLANVVQRRESIEVNLI